MNLLDPPSVLSDISNKQPSQGGKEVPHTKSWTTITRTANNGEGGSSSEVCSFSKRTHMEVDCCDLPNKRMVVSHNNENFLVVEVASQPRLNK